jgi:LynF/TruF/PatF family peptide O-prenyltransferase
MINSANVFSLTDKNLNYMKAHEKVFEIEALYPLEIFENFVQEQTDCTIDCACKIDNDKLYPGRFSLAFYNKQYAEQQIKAAINLFHQVEGRPGVKLNYQQLQNFLGNDFDFNKVIRNLVGVDARRNLTDSRMKLYIWMHNYPEKMATAMALCDENQDLSTLVVNNEFLVGFDFHFDGRTAIELYISFSAEELRRVEVRDRLAKVLSAPALRFIDDCKAIQIGVSRANDSKILYYHTLNPNDFIDNLGNEMASRIHAYYRHQPVKNLVVCIPEQELKARSIQQLNMYYSMN